MSMVREDSKDGSSDLHATHRLILRISDVLTMRVSVPEGVLSDANQERSMRTLIRELLEIVCPQVIRVKFYTSKMGRLIGQFFYSVGNYSKESISPGKNNWVKLIFSFNLLNFFLSFWELQSLLFTHF